MYVLFKKLLFLYSFCNTFFIFQLCLHGQEEGAVKQTVDKYGQEVGGGRKLAKMCRHPLWVSRYTWDIKLGFHTGHISKLLNFALTTYLELPVQCCCPAGRVVELNWGGWHGSRNLVPTRHIL